VKRGFVGQAREKCKKTKKNGWDSASSLTFVEKKRIPISRRVLVLNAPGGGKQPKKKRKGTASVVSTGEPGGIRKKRGDVIRKNNNRKKTMEEKSITRGS